MPLNAIASEERLASYDENGIPWAGSACWAYLYGLGGKYDPRRIICRIPDCNRWCHKDPDRDIQLRQPYWEGRGIWRGPF
jgi:hypothetical protein